MIEYTNIHIPEDFFFYENNLLFTICLQKTRQILVLMCKNLFFKSKFQYFIFNEYFHVWDKSGEVST